jgi:hypothetical protein
VSNAGATTLNGKKAYFVEWSHYANDLQYLDEDYFIFDGATTYQLHGYYPSFSPDKKQIIDQMIQSFKIRTQI